MAHKCKLNIFSIIRYLPQLNLLAENYFRQLKLHTLFHFTGLLLERTDTNKVGQYKFAAIKNHIMKQWDEMTKKHYDTRSTASIYDTWIKALDDCMKEFPLLLQHIHETTSQSIINLGQKAYGTRKIN
ncbi:hypothetical protein M9Y10_022419 [Tritrichomonas musculus]|uniref:Uncharacterized protein n=1 Tax=Tritrichomonas musculus TaxID=1915356 RepID=A0ABR2KSC2_9EUKA